MPELPEVEVVRRGLAPHVIGRTIAEVEVLEPRAARRHAGGPADLVDQLRGVRVAALVRRGKFLWWRLEDAGGEDLGVALMTHLGMSGQLRVRGADAQSDAASSDAVAASSGPRPDPLRHRRITLRLDDGTLVDFIDQRIFGGLWTSPLVTASDGQAAGMGGDDALLPADAAHIGRDLLDPAIDLEAVAARIRARSASVKSLLLNQEIASGIGNIYADEGLWEARVRYDTPGSRVSRARTLALLEATAAVMRRALEVGGTSFDALYVNVDGRSGYFARSLSAYGREGEPCPRCGTAIRRVSFMNRSSHFCPACQRKRS
ncbi:formamidopyrimidine-DNA glycosylase [Brachybacterium phenoliresistens]|uniref:Formamidopyrimidine-DNA glycosylase n=1 Tax=Brachybacterium phenoliresistens TaxID=396014 RepID=Z9JX31_9MICO|nr:bifunctional DNA-formamidopyrimidine glycosylase/DNA-(apurinic or apyrimidinic site) lyase [Brachybacterium phenoliresistens]EWS82523.1 formamidopyrimidine-DNA glycosylase [Brachybacterium phenoliresistens]